MMLHASIDSQDIIFGGETIEGSDHVRHWDRQQLSSVQNPVSFSDWLKVIPTMDYDNPHYIGLYIILIYSNIFINIYKLTKCRKTGQLLPHVAGLAKVLQKPHRQWHWERHRPHHHLRVGKIRVYHLLDFQSFLTSQEQYNWKIFPRGLKWWFLHNILQVSSVAIFWGYLTPLQRSQMGSHRHQSCSVDFLPSLRTRFAKVRQDIKSLKSWRHISVGFKAPFHGNKLNPFFDSTSLAT